MIQFPLTVNIRYPIPYRGQPVDVESETDLSTVLTMVGLNLRVTSPNANSKIILIGGTANYRSKDAFYVGIEGIEKSVLYGYVLEVMAHGFHDYAARESVIGRIKFVPKVYSK